MIHFELSAEENELLIEMLQKCEQAMNESLVEKEAYLSIGTITAQMLLSHPNRQAMSSEMHAKASEIIQKVPEYQKEIEKDKKLRAQLIALLDHISPERQALKEKDEDSTPAGGH